MKTIPVGFYAKDEWYWDEGSGGEEVELTLTERAWVRQALNDFDVVQRFLKAKMRDKRLEAHLGSR